LLVRVPKEWAQFYKFARSFRARKGLELWRLHEELPETGQSENMERIEKQTKKISCKADSSILMEYDLFEIYKNVVDWKSTFLVILNILLYFLSNT